MIGSYGCSGELHELKVIREVVLHPAEVRVSNLERLIKATHTAKGRHHSQLAMCDLYDAVGLPCVRPEQAKRGKA